jgi:hypothetical protein
MRIISLLIATAFITQLGCSKPSTATGVLLRVENTLNVTIDSVIIALPGGQQVYTNIGSNTKSGYKAFKFIYNYAYIKVYTGNSSLVLQPIDYVGETKIENGSYTYRLYTISNLTTTYLGVENIKD